MATQQENQSRHDRTAALLETLTARLGDRLISNPPLADEIIDRRHHA